jgi:hypothetical protein
MHTIPTITLALRLIRMRYATQALQGVLGGGRTHTIPAIPAIPAITLALRLIRILRHTYNGDVSKRAGRKIGRGPYL